MKVLPGRDKFEVSDSELQALLKQYVQAQTGRAVEGPVFINLFNCQNLGDPRSEQYVAVGTLKDPE